MQGKQIVNTVASFSCQTTPAVNWMDDFVVLSEFSDDGWCDVCMFCNWCGQLHLIAIYCLNHTKMRSEENWKCQATFKYQRYTFREWNNWREWGWENVYNCVSITPSQYKSNLIPVSVPPQHINHSCRLQTWALYRSILISQPSTPFVSSISKNRCNILSHLAETIFYNKQITHLGLQWQFSLIYGWVDDWIAWKIRLQWSEDRYDIGAENAAS